MHMGGCPDFARQPCGPDRSVDVLAFAGRLTGALGTSAAAPEFAGVLALEEERLGTRLGDVNPVIYALAAQNAQGHFFRQDIPGGNGVYKATPGYNPVLGNGTLVVKNFVGLPDDPGAGTPQTPSNP
jgi:subtilase family serine protease